MKVLFTRVSANSKIGSIATSISESSTCPDNCSLKRKGGCYAYGGNMRFHWNRLDRSRKKKHQWPEFIKQLKGLFPGYIFRYAQAGDLPGTNNNIDKPKMMELIDACRKIKAFCYTHKPVLSNSKQARKNREIISFANSKGFIVNLSAARLDLADHLASLNIAPVVSIVPTDHPKHSFTPAGRKVLVCPEQTIGITCDRCMLCAKKDRKFIVAFRSHGVSKKSVSARATLPIVE